MNDIYRLLQRLFGRILCNNIHCCWNTVAFNTWSIYCRSFLSWWGEAAATTGKKNTAKQQNRSAFLNPLTPHVSCTCTHSPNPVGNVNITLTQTNTGISAQTSHSSADLSTAHHSFIHALCTQPPRAFYLALGKTQTESHSAFIKLSFWYFFVPSDLGCHSRSGPHENSIV